MLKQIYDRFVDENGNVFRKTKNGLVLCTQSKNHCGYLTVRVDNKRLRKFVHRVVWEAFNGEVPEGFELDHINADRADNRLDNLRLVTHSENMKNPHTVEVIRKQKLNTEFGKKFIEHFNIHCCDNKPLYKRELSYYLYHGKCRWEE